MVSSSILAMLALKGARAVGGGRWLRSITILMVNRNYPQVSSKEVHVAYGACHYLRGQREMGQNYHINLIFFFPHF